jgi:hypothetical protein
MTDYHPLVSRAVQGLDRSTGEARRALYERARTALVTQLRAVEPALSESDITKERLGLEDAIRKVEAEAARKSRVDLREQRPSPPPRREPRQEPARRNDAAFRPSGAETGTAEVPSRPAPNARERLLGAREPSLSQDSIKGFRNVVNEVHDLGSATAKAAQSARNARDSYNPAPARQIAPADQAEELDDAEAGYDSHGWDEEHAAAGAALGHGAYEDQHDGLRHPARRPAGEEHQPPRRSYRGLIQILVALIILAGLGSTISWQWSRLTGLYHSIASIGSRQPSPPAREETAAPKFSERVPQEQSAGQTAGTAGPGSSQSVPAVAQRVVLYEEDPNDPQGRQFVGSAVWRTETVSPGPGQTPELAVRADVTIPERKISMTWSLRRNTDQALPASHTIEIQFTLPPDFPSGGIANVPGILMKQSEQARGTPLAGIAVKVTSGFFLIGLSSADTDLQHNLQLLKERPWFDVPIVYSNGGRAILAMEKGPPGDRAFADAFAAWEKK